MSFFATAVSLFFVLNALGSIPFFIGLLGHFPLKKQRRIILREMTLALGILVVFTLFGDDVLHLLGISRPIIGIAGGTLLFIIALSMIFPRHTDKKPEWHKEEPFIVPLAIPLVAGPGAIATVMVYSEQLHNNWMMVGIILTAWIPSMLILMASSNIKHILGQKGIMACQRLGGMLICLIAVQMFTTGVMQTLRTAFNVVP